MLIAIRNSSRMLRNLSGMLSLLLIFQCVRYSSQPLPPDQPVVFDNTKKVILYSGYNRYKLVNISVQNDHFTCNRVVNFDDQTNPTGVEMHLYLNESIELIADSTGLITIPFEAITHVEIQSMDLTKTVLYSMGTMVGFAGIFFIGLLLTSCPFVYEYDGEEYHFAGEIYAGSVYPPLERHDYLKLANLKESEGSYKIRVANEVREIQHTNLLELIAIDHPVNATVLIDKYGVPRTIIHLESPATAVSNGEYDVLQLVKNSDSELFINEAPLGNEALMDSIVLSFQKPAGTNQAKLFLKGRNSLWLDHVYGALAYQVGNRYEKWQSKQGERSREDLLQMSLDQGVPISVYIDYGAGWEFADYFNIAGPLSLKEDVLNLDISGVHEDFIRVKLTYGHLFWEIDQIAMDFSSDIPVTLTTLEMRKATSQKGGDVSGLLRYDDDQYYVQSEIGDHAELSFEAKSISENSTRTFILHSKGHYKVVRENEIEPNLVHLVKYQKPGGLMEFSRDHMNDLIESIAARK
jgi:hypothetical protein